MTGLRFVLAVFCARPIDLEKDMLLSHFSVRLFIFHIVRFCLFPCDMYIRWCWTKKTPKLTTIITTKLIWLCPRVYSMSNGNIILMKFSPPLVLVILKEISWVSPSCFYAILLTSLAWDIFHGVSNIQLTYWSQKQHNLLLVDDIFCCVLLSELYQLCYQNFTPV